MVFGEISSHANLDYQKIIRGAIKKIGYDDSSKGFDYKTCNVIIAIEQQSEDISQGVDKHGERGHKEEEIGAGDQVKLSWISLVLSPLSLMTLISFRQMLGYYVRLRY